MLTIIIKNFPNMKMEENKCQLSQCSKNIWFLILIEVFVLLS